MSKGHRELPLAFLRRLLLVVLLVFVAAVVGLYFFGRAGRPIPQVAGGGDDGDTTENLVLVGDGFEYEVMREGRRMFHIRADKIVSKQEDDYELEGVEIQITRDDGSEYFISSDQGAYNLETEKALLTGSVLFKGPHHVELRTEGLELRRQGHFVISQTPVTFRFLQRFEGRAKEMRINSRRDLFLLIGRVRVQSLPGDSPQVTLEAKRFSYERRDLLIRAEGTPAVFTRDEDRIEARRLTLTLTEEEDSIRFVNAHWEASGHLREVPSDDIRSTLFFDADRLVVEFDAETEEPIRAELESTHLAGDPAWLLSTDDSGLERRVAGDYLQGDFVDGELRVAQVFDDVEILERLSVPDFPPLRRICSDTAEASFLAGGEIDQIVLDGDVDIHDQDIQARGDRVIATGETGLVELLSARWLAAEAAAEDDPEAAAAAVQIGDLAWAVHERGRIEAPRILYGRDTGGLEAGEGVRAEILGDSQIALTGNPDEAEEPIQVEARFANWSDSPSTVVFREKVRAWQGANYLLTNELEANAETSVLTATGAVKTVWISGDDDAFGLGGQAASSEEGEEGEIGPPEPMEVTSSAMQYDGNERTLTFTGAARAVQGQRRMQCVDITLFRSEEGEFERMHCSGPLRIEDLVEDNVVSGSRAIYYPVVRKVRVWGSPVILRNGEGMELRGQTLVYDFETSTANLQSAEDLEAATGESE